MFGRAFFGAAYYAPRYFGEGGGGTPPPSDELPHSLPFMIGFGRLSHR